MVAVDTEPSENQKAKKRKHKDPSKMSGKKQKKKKHAVGN